MEGLADDILRGVLTAVGGYDWCVTEFVRVSGTLLPDRYFTRVCPELKNGSRTAAGTPVRVQLLGSDPVCLAENAAQLCELAPAGIDLNFGCPAKTVNQHGGGAVLLADPECLFRIAQAVRRGVPKHLPYTAKMRLGIKDAARALDCARALEAGGVEGLVVHARTKEDGYRPPARWEWIALIRDAVRLPVAANGEVWTTADYARCRSVSGSSDVMLGRGAVADPFLARRIRALAAGRDALPDRAAEWRELQPLLADFWALVVQRVEARHASGRLKQWLGLLRRSYPQAEDLYQRLRTLNKLAEIDAELAANGVSPLPLALAA